MMIKTSVSKTARKTKLSEQKMPTTPIINPFLKITHQNIATCIIKQKTKWKNEFLNAIIEKCNRRWSTYPFVSFSIILTTKDKYCFCCYCFIWLLPFLCCPFTPLLLSSQSLSNCMLFLLLPLTCFITLLWLLWYWYFLLPLSVERNMTRKRIKLWENTRQECNAKARQFNKVSKWCCGHSFYTLWMSMTREICNLRVS